MPSPFVYLHHSRDYQRIIKCSLTTHRKVFLTMDTDYKEQAAEPASRKRSKQKQYLEPNLNLAIDAVKSKVMTLGKAADVYGVPKETIHFRLSPKWSGKVPRGPNPVLTTDEKCKLASWIKEMERRGFPCTKDALFSKVKSFLDSAQRVTVFKENTPGYKWLELFMKRRGANDALSIHKPENITRAVATVSEADIRKWFRHIGRYITENNLSDILKDPRRVLNGDKTMFLFDPVTKSVIASKGNRNVYLVQQADSKKNIMVLFTFDADGYIPPDAILPYKRLPQQVLRSLGMMLIALFPNATHIMQPCDVAIFKPLKNQWTKEIDQWNMKNGGQMFTIDHFGAALENSIKTGINTTTVRAGFRKCGLYPFDENAIDYSRCLQRVHDIQPESLSSSLSPDSNVPKPTCSFVPALDICAPLASDFSTFPRSSDSSGSSCHQTLRVSPRVSVEQSSAKPPIMDSSAVSRSQMVALDNTSTTNSTFEQMSPAPDSPMLGVVSVANDNLNSESTLLDKSPFASPPQLGSTPSPPTVENVSLNAGHQLQPGEQMGRRISITNFLELPPTPKRKEIKRNYKQKRHFILTAAEHLQELERKEQEKENAAIRRQETNELRATKKANIEKQKQERKNLLEQRRALKKIENEERKNQQEKKKMEKLKKKLHLSATKKKQTKTSKQVRH